MWKKLWKEDSEEKKMLPYNPYCNMDSVSDKVKSIFELPRRKSISFVINLGGKGAPGQQDRHLLLPVDPIHVFYQWPHFHVAKKDLGVCGE